MRFTDGAWSPRTGYKLHPATYLWKYEIEEDKIHAFVICHPLNTSDDLTLGPALEYTFSAPVEDACRVQAVHFKGAIRKEPAFDLNFSNPKVQILDEENQIVMINGKMRVEIKKGDQFEYLFYYDGKFLTGSMAGSMNYVTDVAYQGDQIDNVNHRIPQRTGLNPNYIRERLNLDVGEYIYGFGEHFTPLVKNGQCLDIWNRDGSSNCEQGYKCIPFYLSSRSYGVLVNTPGHVDFEVGVESVRHVQFDVQDEKIDYIVLGASEPKMVLSRYTEMIGRTPLLPAWSFGLWLSTSWYPEVSKKTVLDAIDGMKANGIPLNVYHFDARWMEDFHDCDFVWKKEFGDPRDLLREIHERDVKVCVWINPYVSQISRLFEEGARNGYFLKKKDGSIWQTDIWMCGMAVVDFTNPAACEWYASRLGEIVDMGVDCIKTDFGERIPTDVVYFDGSDPEKMHNYYPYLYNQTIYNMLCEKRGKENALVFARSATVGTQKFPINWGGDNNTSYISMAESLRGGLSFCMSGYGFWCHDITGFGGKSSPDLYKRWAAFGMLCTHSRLHGKEYRKMPWLYDDECTEVLGKFARLKSTLMPYLYEAAVTVHEQGISAMRAMALEFPKDANCTYLDRQYMLGDALCVAPVFREDGSADFYLPFGTWTDYLTGEKFEGGRWYTRTYDYFHIPLFVRPNSIIAKGYCETSVTYDYTKDLEYQIFELEEGASASCRVCDANGVERVTMMAERTGNQVMIRVNGADCGRPYRILWNGNEIASVSGATRSGMVLTPVGGVKEISLQLRG